MTEAPGAGETEGTRTRGSIARRMLVTAAVWSVIVLAVAGWSLQALYRAETVRQLDTSISEILVTLANAVSLGDDRQPQYDPAKLPQDEKFERVFSGWYWAYLELDGQNRAVGGRQSESFADARPEPSAQSIEDAVRRPGAIVHDDGEGPNDRQLHAGMQAVTFAGRNEPVLLYTAIDRTAADEAVQRFAITLGLALAVLALGILAGVLVVIRYGLRPLHEIEGKLHDVRSGKRERLDGEYPGELSPLVKEINTRITHNRKVVDRARTHV